MISAGHTVGVGREEEAKEKEDCVGTLVIKKKGLNLATFLFFCADPLHSYFS